MKNLLLFIMCCSSLASCKKKQQEENTETSPQKVSYENVNISYATGFNIQTTATGYYLTIKNPWPEAKETYRYKIVKGFGSPEAKDTDAPITIQAPISSIILTSTTHVPPVALLNEIPSIAGFPGTDYISNVNVRKRIDAGKITELGTNKQLSIECVLTIQPDLVMGYGIDNSNALYTQIARAGVPVLYNGDWTEEHPLGKAEWIKVFGILYGKQHEADSIFKTIEREYLKTKKRVAMLKPATVMSGATWKDIWYLPYGDSWQGKLIDDAAGDYTYKETKGKGSLAYNIERVLKDAQKARIWIAPAQYTSYRSMLNDQPAYALFDAFKNKNIYTFALTKGAKGGVTYYEEAAMRPDIVLKDLVTILHPEVDLNHKLYFFKPLTD